MREYLLNVIARQANRPMSLVLASLSGAGISYRVRATAPNVVEYWVTSHGIEGQLVL